MHMLWTLCTCCRREETIFKKGAEGPFPIYRAAAEFTHAQGSVLYHHGFSICNVYAYTHTQRIHRIYVYTYSPQKIISSRIMFPRAVFKDNRSVSLLSPQRFSISAFAFATLCSRQSTLHGFAVTHEGLKCSCELLRLIVVGPCCCSFLWVRAWAPGICQGNCSAMKWLFNSISRSRCSSSGKGCHGESV